jgi:outer membrane lipoprotein SlyB
MLRCLSSSRRSAWLGCLWMAVAAVACLGLSGCATPSYSELDFSHVDSFRGEPEYGGIHGLRPVDPQLTPHAVSNRALQIEQSLGVPVP